MWVPSMTVGALHDNLKFASSEEHNFSQSWPQINLNWLKPREAQFQKNWGFFAAKFWKRANSSASERAFPGFNGDFFGFYLQKEVF